MIRSATAFGFAGPIALAIAIWLGPLPKCHASPRYGADSMLEPHTASLLVDYFETFLRSRDIEAFQRSVMIRYNEGTLERLARSHGSQARRAAILALGLVGSMRVNETVAKGLRDPDPAVRNLSQSALWAIWYRADSHQNNAALQQVRDLIGRERFTEALELADQLIARAPSFAEAYNQRAIAYFSREMFAESALECRRVLERNPYHIGALGGLAQCYLRLDRRRDALATLRRSLKLQPYNDSLRQAVETLEAEVE
jgi:tetratricopeptide (TPR) repeat protein